MADTSALSGTSNGPAAMEALYGHEAAEEAVIAAWNSGRFPHAWFITGPEGVGKATLAYRMARFVLKHGTDAMEEEGGLSLFGEPEPKAEPISLAISAEDGVFSRVLSRGHADFRVLERPEDKTVIPVEEVRKILDFAYQTSAEGGWKAIIIDSADDLNTNSANALLKCIEEPPAKTVFLIVCHRPGRLLPTIRSRCRLVPLGPLEPNAVAAVMADVAPALSSQDAAALGQLAEGRPGRALAYAEAEALDLAQAIASLMSQPAQIDFDKVMGLGDLLSKKGAEGAFTAFRDLLDAFLQKVVKTASAGSGSLQDGLDYKAVTASASVASADIWLDARENALAILDRAGPPANLGRKHVVVNAFIILERAAQGR